MDEAGARLGQTNPHRPQPAGPPLGLFWRPMSDGLPRHRRPAGATIQLEGDGAGRLYIVVSGWLAITRSMTEGHRQIIDVVLPGGVVDPASADPCSSAVDVEALSDVTYATIARQDWQRALRACPEWSWAQDASGRAAMARVSGRMLRLGRGRADSILAYALCELCLRAAQARLQQGRTYHIPMSQRQLGEFCGLSAVHVCRVLQRFRADGLVERCGPSRFKIRDLAALADVADIDPAILCQQILPPAAPIGRAASPDPTRPV